MIISDPRIWMDLGHLRHLRHSSPAWDLLDLRRRHQDFLPQGHGEWMCMAGLPLGDSGLEKVWVMEILGQANSRAADVAETEKRSLLPFSLFVARARAIQILDDPI